MRKCRQEKPVDWDDEEGSRGSLSTNKDVREIDKQKFYDENVGFLA